MNGDQTDPTLSPEFFRGQSYLGKPTTISLVGQEPGGPASGLAAGGVAAPATGPGGIASPTARRLAGGGILTGGGGTPTWAKALKALQQGLKGADLVQKLFGGRPPSRGDEAAFQAQRFGEIAPVYQPLLGAGWTPQEVRHAIGLFGEATPADIQALTSGPGAGTAELLRTGLTTPVSEGGFLASTAIPSSAIEAAATGIEAEVAGETSGLALSPALQAIGPTLSAAKGLATAQTDAQKALNAAALALAPFTGGLSELLSFGAGFLGGEHTKGTTLHLPGLSPEGVTTRTLGGTQTALKSFQEGTGAASAFGGRLGAVKSLDELAALLNENPQPGRFNVGTWGSAPPFHWGGPSNRSQESGEPRFTAALLRDPEIVKRLTVQAGMMGAPAGRPDIADDIRAMIARLTPAAPATAAPTVTSPIETAPATGAMMFPAPPAVGSGEMFPWQSA